MLFEYFVHCRSEVTGVGGATHRLAFQRQDLMWLKSSFILFLKRSVCWWAEPGSGMSPKWQMSGVVQGGGDSGREQPHEPVTARTMPLFAAFSLGWVEVVS